jgi:hypothetical protein
MRELGPVLIANRGEIAIRVARTAHALGLATVGVVTEADAGAAHADACDTVVAIGSYLDPGELLRAARLAGARSVHPGYGFLSESAAFARAVAGAGLVWIGPPPAAIELMGDKGAAKEAAAAAGVPVVPGADGSFPVVVKALAGGGGKGMRVVRAPEELEAATAAAQREALAAFGDDRVLVERYLERPRHIEIQVLADAHGTCVHLGERECSLQRRHQKVVEEAPPPWWTTRCARGWATPPCASRWPAATRARAPSSSSPRATRGVLLPGDEHPPAGRAPVTELVFGSTSSSSSCGWPPASRSGWCRRSWSPAATRWRHGCTPRTRRRASCRPPGPCASTASPRAPACGSTPACGPAASSARRTTRCSRRSSPTAPTAPPPWTGWTARWPPSPSPG